MDTRFEVLPGHFITCLSVHSDYLKESQDYNYRMYETKLFRGDWLNACIYFRAYEKQREQELIYERQRD